MSKPLMAFWFFCTQMEFTPLATREEKFWQHHREEQARRAAGGTTKKPPKSSQVRRKDWTSTHTVDPDDYADLDIAAQERVMPKGETEWLQAKVIRSPLHAGIGQAPAAEHRVDRPAPSSGTAPVSDAAATRAEGTVVEIATGLCRVRAGERTFLCGLRHTLRLAHSGYSNMVAVGDAVIVSHNGDSRGVVEAILPRRSALARPDPFNLYRQQVIVANVDQVLIVAAWREPAFWPELVDRYLIAAGRHNLAPVIVVNKVDLSDDDASLAATAAAYRTAGYHVILTSVVSQVGLAELATALASKTTALAGLSGVGKSSLLSAVEPGLNLRVGEVNERRHEGRHTTTQVTLHPLRQGGFVVDTPGIREFGLAGLKPAELLRFYPEFDHAGPCAYANCTHTREPGCAVKAAVRAGRLAALRYDSYRKIRRDLAD